MQDAVDYLTWTFMYRRFTQNPNYYNLQGVSHRHLSDHLLKMVESALGDLELSKCITIEDDMDLSPLNLGMISSYYYISYTTIERFSLYVTSITKMKGLLEVPSEASEYSQLPIRPGEEVRKLINHQVFSFENPEVTYTQVKALALLQAHFSRQLVGGNLALDLKEVLLSANRLLQAMVYMISSNGWLSLALLAMEVNQMVTQGMWERDSNSMLLQLPHFTKDQAKTRQENPGKSIETVFDLLEMEDDERHELLGMLGRMLLSWSLRDLEGKTELGPVDALRYPKAKEKGWWLLVGDTETNLLLAIKRVSLQRKLKAKLEFAAPADAGRKSYALYFMCDSYLGCDQEYGFTVDVKEADGGDENN
ncbi:hypothetical protein Fmac_014230 [Flemingia macrophylla]|uniref:SEC63 domain-containing protein n=1 Tax=Flemingia macrophylla TaxID=520843 RepID=A0ABD1MBM8_9FABA